MLCAACRTEVAPSLLSCPVCHSLVHADELKRLAREAAAVAVWAAIAKWGALINLFNLLPIWGLDGGRGFHALSRGQKVFAAAALGVLWAVTREGMLILLLILAVFQAFSRRNAEPGDRLALAQYVFLAAVLAAMCRIEVPGV